MSQYQKGHSGGPGRPPGSRNKAYALYDSIARESMEKAVRAIGELAGKGDVGAARLLFGRIWPNARHEAVELDLPPLEKPEDLVKAFAALIAATAEGRVTPQQATRIAEMLEKKRLAIETAIHEPRISELEDKVASRPAS
jgi:hypothetical protein